MASKSQKFKKKGYCVKKMPVVKPEAMETEEDDGVFPEWTLEEQLLLALAVQEHKKTNWEIVSKIIKRETRDSNIRPADCYSMENCKRQYQAVTENFEKSETKPADASANTNKLERIIEDLYEKREVELKERIAESIAQHKKHQELLRKLRNNELDDATIIEMHKRYEEIEKAGKLYTEQKKLALMNKRKNAELLEEDKSPLNQEPCNGSPCTCTFPVVEHSQEKLPPDNNIKETEESFPEQKNSEEKIMPNKNIRKAESAFPEQKNSQDKMMSNKKFKKAESASPEQKTSQEKIMSSKKFKKADGASPEQKTSREKMMSSEKFKRELRNSREKIMSSKKFKKDEGASPEQKTSKEKMMSSEKFKRELRNSREKMMSSKKLKKDEGAFPEQKTSQEKIMSSKKFKKELRNSIEKIISSKHIKKANSASPEQKTSQGKMMSSRKSKKADGASPEPKTSQEKMMSTKNIKKAEEGENSQENAMPDQNIKEAQRASLNADQLQESLSVNTLMEETKGILLKMDHFQTNMMINKRNKRAKATAAEDKKVQIPKTPIGSPSDAKKLAANIKKNLLLILSLISSNRHANIFLRHIKDKEAPDYASTVKKPTDLLVIKKAIESGEMTTIDELEYNILLMFTNAFMYNNSDEEVIAMTNEMFREALDHIKDYRNSLLPLHKPEPKCLRYSHKKRT